MLPLDQVQVLPSKRNVLSSDSPWVTTNRSGFVVYWKGHQQVLVCEKNGGKSASGSGVLFCSSGMGFMI